MRHFTLTVAAALWGSSALAQATPEGAAELTSLFQTYLGATPGVVSVAPEGEAYGVKVDFTPLLAKLPPEMQASVSPMVMTVADNGDGTWDVTQDQGVALTLKVPGQMDMTMNIASFTAEGTFDESLMGFSESTYTFSDFQMAQTVTDPMGASVVRYSVASGSYTSEGAAGAEGGVDGTSAFEMQGLTEVMTLPPMGEGAPPMEITARAETYTGNGKITGIRPDAIYRLLAFFVANPSKPTITAAQADLKAILTEGMPIFDHIASDAVIAGITVETPFGTGTADELQITVEANGIVEDGLLREAFVLRGLALPEGLVPTWAVDLVPSDVTLDFAGSGFDLATPTGMILSALDLSKEPPLPPEMEGQLPAALLPAEGMVITLGASGATAPAYTLAMEGAVNVGLMAPPSGAATVTLEGIEAISAALQSAPPEIAQEVAPMVAMAQGLGQPGDGGGLVWEVDWAPNGAISVNGMELVPGQP